MAYIALKNEKLPGIVGLLNFRPETASPLMALAELLLRSPSSMSSGEREIIAASVSYWNNCHFCLASHGASAAAHLGAGISLIDQIKVELPDYPLTEKFRALLDIAHQVQQAGSSVTPLKIALARAKGATDQEIHDTVLIAATFCMYNRYVDGLGTWAPRPHEAYTEMGERMASIGYGKTSE